MIYKSFKDTELFEGSTNKTYEYNIEDKDIDSVVLILEKLKELDFYFDQKDSLDRTALDIAKTSKNEKFIDFTKVIMLIKINIRGFAIRTPIHTIRTAL